MPVTSDENIRYLQPASFSLPRPEAKNVDNAATYNQTTISCDVICGSTAALQGGVVNLDEAGNGERTSIDDQTASTLAIKKQYFRSVFSIDSLLCTDRQRMVTSVTDVNRQKAETSRPSAVGNDSRNYAGPLQSDGYRSIPAEYRKLQPAILVLTGSSSRSTQLDFDSRSHVDLRLRQVSAYPPPVQTRAITSNLSPRLHLFPLQKCRLKRHRADRKPRQPFSSTQLAALESAYDRCPYLTVSERVEVAASLGLDDRRVKIWFQNRRAKCRRIAEARLDERNRERLIEASLAAAAAAKGSRPNFSAKSSAFAPASIDKPQNALLQQFSSRSSLQLPSADGLLLDDDRADNATECRNQVVASNVLSEFVGSSAATWTEFFRRVAAEMSAERQQPQQQQVY